MSLLHAEIPFEKTKSLALIPWVVGLMIYLFMLATYLLTFTQNISTQWESGFRTHLTVEIPHQDKLPAQALDQKINHLSQTLLKLDFIKGATRLQEDDYKNLLTPWFGTIEHIPFDLGIPTFIDVSIKEHVSIDNQALQDAVQHYFPDAQIVDQRAWQKPFLSMIWTIQGIGGILAILICVTAICTMIFTMQSSFVVNMHIVDVLYLVGASHTYIVKQFQGQALRLGMRSYVIATLLMALTLIMLFLAAGEMQLPSYFSFALPALCHLLLFVFPALLVLLMTFAARITVLRALLTH